ncbi:MAG: family 16 glycoside hydrolase [Candidatus Promineifilaceae bacterium]
MSDDFSQDNRDRWRIEQDSYGRSLIHEGKLFIEINQPNTIEYVTLRQPLLADFNLSVDATLLGGSTTSSYGILFRKQELGGFYRFEVTGNGDYIIERRDATGLWTRLLPENRWQKSEFINRGVGATNRLGVTANGNSASFYVNGELIHSIETFDQTYGTGNIALEAGSYAQPGVQVAFDDLVILEPQ